MKWRSYAARATIVLAVAFALFLGWRVHEAWVQEPVYDVADPDYAHFSHEFDRLAAAFEHREPTARDTLDLAPLNGGRWTTACLFGGYTDPVEKLERMGVRVPQAEQRRMAAASGGFRLAPVEEFEVVIAYIDAKATTRLIHFKNGFGPSGQHFERCVSKPETVMPISMTASVPAE